MARPEVNYDMDRICDRLRFALLEKGVSKQQAAREIGVSRDLVFDYTNCDYPEKSMQVDTLKKFAEYFRKEDYYFCNEYHCFLDTVDAGAFLREQRVRMRMTREQFAAYLEIPLSRYKAYAGGRCRIPEELFEKLRHQIEVAPRWRDAL